MTTSQSTSCNLVTSEATFSGLSMPSGSEEEHTAGVDSRVSGDITSPIPSTHSGTVPGCVADMSSISTALDCGVIPALAVLGIAGNVLCVVVFLKQRYRTVAKPLLLALCASDMLFLLASLLVSLPCIVKKVNDEDGKTLRVYLLPQVAVFRDVMIRVTVMLTLAIGVERCVAVTRPLKLRGVCTIPRTRTVVLIIFLCVLALKSPAFFRYDVKHHVSDTNVTTVELHKTSFYLDNGNALDFYLDYLLLVILQGLPLVSITVCFFIVLVCLKRRLQCAYPKTITQFGAFARTRHNKGQDRYTEKEHADLVLEESKLTRALLVILLLCIICELPYLVTEVIHVTRSDIQSSSFLVARDVSRLLCVLNSATNFVVFMCMYKNFSVTFKTLAGLCN